VKHREGALKPPEHDEDRARREFRLLEADEARMRARSRLESWLAAHPDCRIVPYGERVTERTAPDA
jgi:hypothetical protein